MAGDSNKQSITPEVALGISGVQEKRRVRSRPGRLGEILSDIGPVRKDISKDRQLLFWKGLPPSNLECLLRCRSPTVSLLYPFSSWIWANSINQRNNVFPGRDGGQS